MKIAIHSDLHLEGNRLPDSFGSNQEEVEVVVLAGDIGVRDLDKNLADIRKAYPKQEILFCPGNHEYYGYEFHERNEEMKKICDDTDIFFMTSKAGIAIGGVYFIGSTCWSDMSSVEGYPRECDKEMVQRSVSDFYKIRMGDRRFTVDDMIEISKEEKKNLDRILRLSLDEDIWGDDVVVVSHFPPLVELGNPIFAQSALTSYFHNDWLDIIEKGMPTAWIYGHTHYNSPLSEHKISRMSSTRFLSNQRGYNKEASNEVYRPDYIVEI